MICSHLLISALSPLSSAARTQGPVSCFTTEDECSSPTSTDFFEADSLEACCLDSRGFYARVGGPTDTNCDQCIGESPRLQVFV